MKKNRKQTRTNIICTIRMALLSIGTHIKKINKNKKYMYIKKGEIFTIRVSTFF